MTDPVLPAPVTASGKPIGPGFRFHPTDEELITYYLKRKVEGKPMRFDVIREVNIYKHEPSDLAELSRLKTKDQEWYFFCPLEKRQNSSTVINRATKEGYWKKTGDDKKIKREGDDELIGVGKNHIDEDPNTVDQDDNNSEPLTRGCLPLTTLVQYKRKRQLDSFGSYNNSSQTTQDAVSSVAATLEENEVATMVPTSSSTELIDHLETEKQEMAVARETYNLDLMSAEVMVSILQGQVDALRAEHEELKKTNINNG
ncbi:hypothetical protein YC2023_124017 [Brassica napus]